MALWKLRIIVMLADNGWRSFAWTAWKATPCTSTLPKCPWSLPDRASRKINFQNAWFICLILPNFRRFWGKNSSTWRIGWKRPCNHSYAVFRKRRFGPALFTAYRHTVRAIREGNWELNSLSPSGISPSFHIWKEDPFELNNLSWKWISE